MDIICTRRGGQQKLCFCITCTDCVTDHVFSMNGTHKEERSKLFVYVHRSILFYLFILRKNNRIPSENLPLPKVVCLSCEQWILFLDTIILGILKITITYKCYYLTPRLLWDPLLHQVREEYIRYSFTSGNPHFVDRCSSVTTDSSSVLRPEDRRLDPKKGTMV